MRGLVRLGYAVRRRLLARLRWPTRGVKVMAFDGEGRLLLVRHGYGRTDLWMLPGGGIGRRESPEAAARREMMEELDCRLDGVEVVGVHTTRAEGKRDTVHLFRATTVDTPRPDGREVIEARFFPLDALPPAASPATRRRVEELQGTRERIVGW